MPPLSEEEVRSALAGLPGWELGDGDWLKIVWLGRYAPRRAMRAVVAAQLPLFEPDTID